MPLFSEPNRQKKPDECKMIPTNSYHFLRFWYVFRPWGCLWRVPGEFFPGILQAQQLRFFSRLGWDPLTQPASFCRKKNRAGEWTAGCGAGVKGFQTPGDVVKIYDWKSFRNTIPTLLFKYGCLIRYFIHMIFSWQGTGHFKTCWKWPILVPQKNNGTPKRVVIQKGSNIHNTSSQRL